MGAGTGTRGSGGDELSPSFGGRRLRRIGCWAALALCLVLTAGCSVESTGVTGVGVDASGDLVGFVQMCSDRIDGATLYERDGETLGEWSAPSPVTDFGSWSLAEPGGWSPAQAYVRPEPGKEYSVYGWTEDDTTSSQHVTFRLSDLDGLRPGEVLFGDRGVGFNRMTEAEFRRQACADR